MSDTPTPTQAPAGSEITPAPAPSFEAMNESAALEQLLALEGGDGVEDQEPSAEGDGNTNTAEELAETPEGEEAGEAADEEPADDAAEPQTNEAPPEDDETGTRLHRLRDGTQVSLADLKKGFDEARGYRQALPQIQAERARIEQDRQAIVAREQQFQPLIAQVAAILQEQIPPEASDELWQTDPIAAQMQDRERGKALARLAQVNAAQTEAQQRQAAEVEAQRARYLQGEQQKLAQAIPDLRDPVKAKAFADEIHEVGAAVGFTPQDFGQVYDHRLLLLARYAAKGFKAEKAEKSAKAVAKTQTAVVAAKVAGKPPVAAPAARVGTNVRQAEVARGAMDRLRKNPSNTDAQIAALLALE
jgi:hypothetical protein